MNEFYRVAQIIRLEDININTVNEYIYHKAIELLVDQVSSNVCAQNTQSET